MPAKYPLDAGLPTKAKVVLNVLEGRVRALRDDADSGEG